MILLISNYLTLYGFEKVHENPLFNGFSADLTVLTLYMLVSVMKIVNSNPIPVRKQNIATFYFANSNIKMAFLIVGRQEKA